MKKLLILSLLMFKLWGDLPPPEGYHFVERKSVITNVSHYPNHVVIGYIAGDLVGSPRSYLVEDNVALARGYKFDPFYIIVMSRELFDTYGGLEAINFDALRKAKGNLYSPFPYEWDTADDNCSVTKDTYYYRIESINDSNTTFELQKRILTDRDGATQTITY